MKKLIVYLIVFILMLNITIINANAIYCEFDNEPYINDIPFKEDKFYWFCNMENTTESFKCFSYIKDFNTREILQLNPTQIYMDRVGVVEKYFEAKEGLVNVYFTDKRIMAGGFYTAYVTCFDGNGIKHEYSAEINPTIREFDWVASRGAWTKDYMSIIFAGLILFVAVVAVFVIGKRLIQGGRKL